MSSIRLTTLNLYKQARVVLASADWVAHAADVLILTLVDYVYLQFVVVVRANICCVFTVLQR